MTTEAAHRRRTRGTYPSVCGYFLGSVASFKSVVFTAAIIVLLSTPSMAELASFFDEPDTVFASNTVIGVIEHNGGVWFATGEGLNFSMDSGRTWLLYDASNGLVSDNISALYSVNGRIWVATNDTADDLSVSDGLSYSDDNGDNWIQVDFEALGVPYVWGAYRTIFDITGHDDVDRGMDWLFFTAFAGGFVASQDGGMNWRRIYSSASDSANFVNTYKGQDTLRERNRYFSCVADTSHGDSLFVWAGTAGGVYQYVYAVPREKPFSKRINRIAFCNLCDDTVGSFVFFAGNNGVTRGITSGAPFISRFESDGLPGPYVSALIDFSGKLFVGTMAAQDGASTGLAVSTDQGDTYIALSSFTDVIGLDKKISGFTVIRERLYMTAEEAGLFVSVDTGETWSHIYVDSSDTTSDNRRNVVHALNALADTLRVGTDSGLITMYLDSIGQIDSSRFDVFSEGDSSSIKVIRVKTQLFYDSTGMILDSLVVWTVNRPLTPLGTPVVFRSYNDTLVSPEETDTLWQSMQWGVNTNDISFIGDSAFAVGEAGIRFTRDGTNPSFIYEVKDSTSTDKFLDENINVMEVKDDTIFIGSDNGFAISNNRGQEYKIYRVNTDSLGADFVVNFASNVPGITGDFIPALGVQYIGDESARMWVSNRPTHSGSEAISVGLVVPVDSYGNIVHPDSLEQAVGFERRWEAVYPGAFAWDFAFKGDSVFAATNGGLLFNCQDTGRTWRTIDLVDAAGNQWILPNDSVIAVEVIDHFLWVGTTDRTVRLDLSTLIADTSFFYIDTKTPSDIVYAFPIPFSYSSGGAVDFHFVVENDVYVTLEVYDFAMNLVKRVIDNEFFPVGTYHSGGPLRKRPTWDGTNASGAKVAVGIYYFKVEYSTGEVRWGKIAVIP